MQIKRVETHVQEVIRETPDTVTLVLDLGGESFEYKAGQAVGIDPHQFKVLGPKIEAREAEKGMPEMERSYSLASYPGKKGIIEITVKLELDRGAGPILSPYLVGQVKEGDSVVVNGPFGLFVLPEPLDDLKHTVHICAGSGVVPSRAVINDAGMRGLKLTHTLIYQSRAAADIIYREEWDRLAGAGVVVVHVLSRPDDAWKGFCGYLTPKLVREHVKDPAHTIAFVCGPNRPRDKEPGFLDKFAGNRKANIAGVLGEIGLDRKRIKKEIW